MMGVLGYKRLLIFSLNHNYRFSDSGNEQSQLSACASSLHKAHTLNRFVETRTAAAEVSLQKNRKIGLITNLADDHTQ
jgi:hypothetical protein